MEGEIQITPAIVGALPVSGIATADRPYWTGRSLIRYAAPYVGRIRALKRISLQTVVKFTPEGTAKPPATLEALFMLWRGGARVFTAPQESELAQTLANGVAFYQFDLQTDFNNPIQMTLPDNLQWSYSGVLKKQEGVVGAPVLRFAGAYELEPEEG